MLLTSDQYTYLFINDSLRRHGLERSFQHWPNATVFYKMDDLLPDELRTAVSEAMQYISSVSCVKFQVANGSIENYAFIKSGSGCSSSIGNLRKGKQFVKLSHHCKKGNIVHELLRTLGFLHMHVSY